MSNTLEAHKCVKCNSVTEFIKDEMAFNQVDNRFIERAVYYCSFCDETIYRDNAYNVGWAEVRAMSDHFHISPEQVIELIKDHQEAEKYKEE